MTRLPLRLLVSLGLALFAAMPLAAGAEPSAAGHEVTVSVRFRGSAIPAPRPQAVHGVARWFGPGKVESVSFDINSSKPTSLTLPSGRWVLQAETPGYWNDGYQLELKDVGAVVALELWPAGAVEGGFSLEEGVTAPAELAVSFRSAPEIPSAQALPRSHVVCPVQKQAWSCSLPAGVVDLRIEAPGFIPRYLWGVRIEPGGTLRPGRMDLRRGSAVLGWVVTADGTSLGDGATVSLRPRGAAGARRPGDQQRLENLTFQAAVNSRGFFEIDGIPPGAYVLEARHPKLAPATTSVRVVPGEGESTEIANPPLVLEPPKTLRCTSIP